MVKRNFKLIGLVILTCLIVCPLTYADKNKASNASEIEKQMWQAAKKMDFEKAASLRDQLKKLKMSSSAEEIEKKMWGAAKKLDFERAADLRNQLKKLKGNKKKKVDKQVKGESERQVKKEDVPKAALKTLKKLAGQAKITEFAEEIEYGHKFYEGSWKSSSGANIDALVTEYGALVEIEKHVETDDVPSAVLKVVRKAAGKDAKLSFEKKTMILYEVKFSKDNNRHELLLTPDGRRVEEEIEKGKSNDEKADNVDDGKRKMKARSDDGDDEEDDV
jgi:excinuclease UvrABC nuclease subunit